MFDGAVMDVFLDEMAAKYDYVRNFDPDMCIAKSPMSYSELRADLLQRENKYILTDYVTVKKEKEVLVVLVEKFQVCFDEIDEEESLWVDKTVIMEVEYCLGAASTEQIIDDLARNLACVGYECAVSS